MGKAKLFRYAKIKEFPFFSEFNSKVLFQNQNDLNIDWSKNCFKNNNPIILEVGAGLGDYSLELAKLFPNKNFIAADIKSDRLYKGCCFATQNNLKNIWFIRTNLDKLDYLFAKNFLEKIIIPFPDPYPKKRDKERRLISSKFLEKYKKILIKNGRIIFKTDSRELFDFGLEEINKFGSKIHYCNYDIYAENDLNYIYNIKTYYETAFLKEGRKIKLVEFEFKN